MLEQRAAQRVVDTRHVDDELVDEIGDRTVAWRGRLTRRQAEKQQRGDAFTDQRDERRVGVTFDNVLRHSEVEVSRMNGHAVMLRN